MAGEHGDATSQDDPSLLWYAWSRPGVGAPGFSHLPSCYFGGARPFPTLVQSSPGTSKWCRRVALLSASLRNGTRSLHDLAFKFFFHPISPFVVADCSFFASLPMATNSVHALFLLPPEPSVEQAWWLRGESTLATRLKCGERY